MPIVTVGEGDDVAEVAAALLSAAAPDKWRVRKVTSGSRAAFDVPDDVYEKFAGDEPPHEPPSDDDSAGRNDNPPTEHPPVAVAEPGADDDADGDKPAEPVTEDRGEAPDRNDKTAEWQAYMRPVLGDQVDTMTRTQLIEAYDNA